jgi:rhombotail lipoprotein
MQKIAISRWLGRALVLGLAGAAGGCQAHCCEMAPINSKPAHGLVDDAKQVSQLEKAITDGDIARLLDVDIRAKLPTPLAIARVQACYGGYVSTDEIDADELKAWDAVARNYREITGVTPVARVALGGGLHDRITLHSLREQAARAHCELLLVYVQADRSTDNFNDASVLYWSIIGLWVVPGDHLEHRTVMQALLLDCRTGMILGTATGDSHERTDVPAAFADNHKTMLETTAHAKALADLQKASDRLLGQVVAAAKR